MSTRWRAGWFGFCPQCGTSTRWHRASDHMAIPSSVSPPAKQALSPIKPQDEQKASTTPAELAEGNPPSTRKSTKVSSFARRAHRRSRLSLHCERVCRTRRVRLPRLRALPAKRTAGVTFARASALRLVFGRLAARKSSSVTTFPGAACHFAAANRTPSVRCSRLRFPTHRDPRPSLSQRPSGMSKLSMSAHCSATGLVRA